MWQVSTSGANGGKPVALKEIDIGTLEEDEEALEMLEAEVLALRRAAGSPHVVALHEVVQATDAVFLAMERVPGRELFELVEERGALDLALVRSLTRQLCTALAALAQLGVVHRDVKPENLMITEEEGGTSRLTLIDFGYAALLGSADGSGSGGATAEGEGLLSGVAGSPEYAAPEVLSWLEVEADETGTIEGKWYDAGCDLRSVGVTVHVLLSAELPFEMPEEGDEADIVAAARNMTLDFRKRDWQAEAMAPAKAFVRACMVPTRADRPSASDLLEHAWLSNGTNAPAPAKVNAAFVEMLDETAAIERGEKLPPVPPVATAQA